MSTPMSGRRAQAARNDGLILEAAREVFLADPGAPISAVAARAGVGISALYRRYDGKEALLRALAGDGLTRFRDELRTALAAKGDAWATYCTCLERVLDGRSQGLAQRLAGTFRPTEELTTLATEAGELFTRLHRRTQRAGALRRDVTTADVVLLLEMVMLVEVPGDDGGAALRHRYLALILESLHAAPGQAVLPGRAASDDEVSARWRART